ncbi:MAG: SHOCT domain-containing protein [Nitrospirae bacterium]|nr:SHOCT domain-containing protein [Nitrospirota bacterium]
MGIADELEKLEELHRKGTLSDEEFEKAKASVIDTTTKLSQSATTPKEADSSISKPTEIRAKASSLPKVKRFLKNLFILSILIGLAWFFLTRTVGKQSTEKMISSVVHTPITLVDEIENISASSWKAMPLNLSYSGTLNLTVEVVRGNPVDIVVIHSTELENYKNSNQFQHFPDFEASKTTSYKRSARLNEGIYYLIIRDNTLGILSTSSSDIKVIARLEP